jgi:hypothetical protein
LWRQTCLGEGIRNSEEKIQRENEFERDKLENAPRGEVREELLVLRWGNFAVAVVISSCTALHLKRCRRHYDSHDCQALKCTNRMRKKAHLCILGPSLLEKF